MIRLTNLADYAVVLMGSLARRDSRVNAADLASETGLPVPTVSKILGALSRAGLALSHRGLKGGFSLARPSSEISIADVIEAVDGPIALVHCIENAPGDCDFEPVCSMRTHWQVINAAVRDGLSGVTVADIAHSPLPPAFAQMRGAARDKF
ncbi:SUF system Fe-S cluster assembly regulator [Iodidimonas gelatinilytica]|uniref:SUF system Fe-S cluster assembly regulator n=2 Tax=Iodidimonas TaxID=2066486 RepID=A0A5A7MTW3_9PROT|nr:MULTISPECIES: SUF system Fe-S cluster assembly regulator [Iodidimonas]GEQ98723.1 SUF system Fe-S cluster assembly regulator [Iodidimonas gelatinilytica]GER00869.1 SUF system Fe-S cluster assembly regulator [Iodidimonas gelatinilytica]GER05843.1 SUF system Fe-S cluster assembly regulator [Kordiimonadales bacterium JCM 17843]GGO07106.1 SUF system Fe-S cluster assembly regulator [Iodidimonas muriae]